MKLILLTLLILALLFGCTTPKEEQNKTSKMKVAIQAEIIRQCLILEEINGTNHLIPHQVDCSEYHNAEYLSCRNNISCRRLEYGTPEEGPSIVVKSVPMKDYLPLNYSCLR